jgi:hypothetical protein
MIHFFIVDFNFLQDTHTFTRLKISSAAPNAELISIADGCAVRFAATPFSAHVLSNSIAPKSHQSVIACSELQDTDLRRRMTHIRVVLVLVRVICRFFHMVVASECLPSSWTLNQEVRNNASHLLSWLDGVSFSLKEGAHAASTSDPSSFQSLHDSNASPDGEKGPNIIPDSTPIRILLYSHIAMIKR